MAGRKKGAVRNNQGTMCNVCGLNCGKGGALKKHLEEIHNLDYADYKMCFYGTSRTIIADAWDDSVNTSSGKKAITHVLVRRFVGNPGPRGVPRSARLNK